MLPVHSVLCPREGDPSQQYVQAYTLFFQGSSPSTHFIWEHQWMGDLAPLHCLPCRHSLVLRMSQVAHKGVIWQGANCHYLLLQTRLKVACGESSWELALWNPITTSKDMQGEAIQLQLLLLLQDLRQEGWLFWRTHLISGALFPELLQGIQKNLKGNEERMRTWTPMPKTEHI